MDLRAQDPHGRYGFPMLSLVSGHYPTGPGEVAVTSGVASLFNLRIGDRWHQGGHARRVVGLVENPAYLLDEFALVSPGQVSAPTQVTVLFDATAVSVVGLHFPGGATPKRLPPPPGHGISPATIVLVVAVFGLIFIGLVAVAGFTVMGQRRLRSLGMLAALGATDRNVRLVMVANGAVVGAVGTFIGAAVGFAAWIAYAPRLQASVEHRVEWSNLPWWAIATAMALAVVTAIVAAWRPARSAARIPVVAALFSRRSASPCSSPCSSASWPPPGFPIP
jgi:putative ABC transport system permease protein